MTPAWSSTSWNTSSKVATDPHYPGHFATAPFWFPESTNDMARSEMLTGALPFYLLPRLVLPRDAAYDAFLIIVATLNFFRALLAPRLAAGAGPPLLLAGIGKTADGGV